MLCEKFVRLCLSVAFLAGGTWFADPANADTIYYDTFTGTDGTALNSHVPDVTTGGASWGGDSIFSLQSGAAATSGVQDAAGLPFVPTSGHIYTLSADVNVPTGSTTKWLAIGFTNAWSSITDAGYAWMLQRDNGEVFVSPGLGTTEIHQCDSVATGVVHHYSVVLDTTHANWSATWSVGGNTVYQSTYSDSGPAGIQYVMLMTNGTLGSYDNVTLSYTSVPEPAAVALLATGVIGLLTYAWRRRR